MMAACRSRFLLTQLWPLYSCFHRTLHSQIQPLLVARLSLARIKSEEHTQLPRKLSNLAIALYPTYGSCKNWGFHSCEGRGGGEWPSQSCPPSGCFLFICTIPSQDLMNLTFERESHAATACWGFWLWLHLCPVCVYLQFVQFKY